MTKKSAIVSRIIDNIRRVFKVVNDQSKKAEHETGITGPQLWTIKVIGDLSPVRVSDLARRMYLHPATVVGILDRLESRKLVKRVRSKDDRRVVKVTLTEEGKRIIARAPRVAQGLLVAGLEVLPTKRLLELDSALDELVHILGAQKLPPQLMVSPEVNVPRLKKVTKEKE
ncbi:MAG TPA: MarR family transcriptional regulator [Syntrophales bacterium]|nr:MarR family transcriptional regulator [Syntrophales bacterium]